MSWGGHHEARAVTVVVLVLAASVAVGGVFPAVEQLLNTVFLVVGGVVLAIYVFLIVRDVFL